MLSLAITTFTTRSLDLGVLVIRILVQSPVVVGEHWPRGLKPRCLLKPPVDLDESGLRNVLNQGFEAEDVDESDYSMRHRWRFSPRCRMVR
jgi:hypothetical protein